jgi:iron complex outermembrane receptor protein
MNKFRVLIAILALPFFTVSPGIFAAERSALLEEVVVTARKRATEESLQDTPISATIYTAEKIDLINAVDIRDLGQSVPNVRLVEQGNSLGYASFYIRGAGVSPSVPSFDPAVGIVIDGVPMAQAGTGVIDTFDLETVEILRGPQGTLFGRNVSGGVVNMRTIRPDGEFGFKFRGTAGSHNRFDVSASIQGALNEDIAAKLTVLNRTRDGFVKDFVSGDDFGEIDVTIVRPTIVWQASEDLQLSFLYEYYENTGHPPPVIPTGATSEDGSTGGLIPGGARSNYHSTWYDNPQPSPAWAEFERNRFTLEAIWDIGHGTVTSITGYADMDQAAGQDFDGTTPANIFSTVLHTQQDQFSQEIRYASSFSDTFDFTVGAMYFTQDVEYGEQRYQGSRVACCVNPGDPIGAGFPGKGLTDHNQWAVFFETHYAFTESLSGTLGARYGREEKETQVGMVNSGNCIGAGTWRVNYDSITCPLGMQIDDDESWNNLDPKVGLEYRISDDVMTYVSWSTGYRGGGWTYRADVGELLRQRPGFYDEEQVESTEIGFKGTFLEGRLRANITFWQNDFDDLQRSVFLTEVLADGSVSLTQRFTNVSDSETDGIDIEIVASLMEDGVIEGDNLVLEVNYGKIDAKYNSPVDFNGDGIDDSSNPWNQMPDHTYFTALTYTHPAFGGSMTYRTSYTYIDGFIGGGTNLDPISFYQDQKLWDATVRFQSGGDARLSATLFGKNLGDEEYMAFRTRFSSAFGIGVPALGRTWGLTFGYEI